MRTIAALCRTPGATPCRSGYRFALLIACSLLSWPLRAADDPREIVRQALHNNARNREIERSYTYTLREETRKLDSGGAVKSRESRTWDVIPLQGGAPFRRLIQREDKPLSPKEEQAQVAARQKQEAERLKRQQARAREPAGEKQKRIDARARSKKQQEEEMDEIVNGFDLKLVGEEQVDGMPVWVIEGAAHTGYKFQSKNAANFFSKMKGRIWVAKDSFQAVRIDAETTDTISFGGIVARLNKGTRVHVEYTYVNGEVWLPKRESFTASARILLVKGFHQEGDNTFSNYKKFTADSRIVSDQ